MKKAVIVISSHVARGSVGNRATVFALEVLGHPVWAVPTVTLPFHPGHKLSAGRVATRIVPDDAAFAALLGDLETSPWIGEVAAVLTGYLANADQVSSVAGFIERLKQRNADLLHVCDPVMGDHGRLYIAEETAVAIAQQLVPLADVLTPNRFEFGWLSDEGMPTLEQAVAAASGFEGKMLLVTSMPGMMRGTLANLLVSNGKRWMAEHRKVDTPLNGPGDLTAALLLSHLLDGAPDERALQQVTASVFEIVSNAARRGADELMLETDAGSIRRPMAPVAVRMLG